MNEKVRRFKKRVSIILLLAMFFSICEFQTFAGPNHAYAATTEGQKRYVVKELEDKRTENSTTYLNSDGTKTVNVYNSPIRYKDKDGKLVDIDNSIEEISETSKKNKYKNKSNKFDVLFPESINSDEFITISYENYQISLKPKKNSNLEAIPAEKQSDEKNPGKINKLKYKDVFEKGIDINYNPTDLGLKEDIILTKRPESNSFQYQLNIPGLVPEKKDDNNVLLKNKDTGEVIGVIPRPYMFDSSEKEKYSEDIEVKVEKSNDKDIYLLTYVVNEKFLQDETTTYPVTIDPTVIVNTQTIIYDSFVQDRYPTSNYYMSDTLRVGYYDSATGNAHSFVRYELPDINGGIITNASFNAYEYLNYTNSSYIDIYRVYGSWASSTITWNNQPSYSSSYEPGSRVNVYGTGWFQWNITKLVSDWYSGAQANYGFVLKEASYAHWRKFYSAESSSRPYLSVDYNDTVPNPTASAYGNGANSGTGYVNLSWPAIAGAAGYNVAIFNGYDYQYFNVGNVTSWSTSGKRIWPTPAEVQGGRFLLHSDGLGADLPDDPVQTYIKSGGNYQSSHNYWFRIMAYNAYGQASYLYSNGAYPTLPDRTKPLNPTSVTISGTNGAKNSGDAASISLSWNGVTDKPDGIASGVKHYEIQKIANGGTAQTVGTVAHTGTGLHSFTLTNQPDLTNFILQVRAIDNNGNYSDFVPSQTWTSLDRTPPVGPTTLSINPSSWTNANTLTLNWSGASDVGVGIVRIEYSIDNNINWVNTNSNAASGSISIDISALTDGQHKIAVRAVDGQGNETATPSEIIFNKDATKPAAAISTPASNSFISGTVNIAGTASDAYFKQYKLERSPAAGTEVWTQIGTTRTTAVTNGTLESFNTTQVPDGAYKIRLTVSDNNNDSVSIVSNITVDNTTETDKAQITSPETDSLIDGIVEIWGLADETNFSSAKLEYGSGTSPTSWTLLKTISTPVKTNSLLHSWNVSGIAPGAYTLKLTVTDKTNHVVTKTVKLTIPDRLIPANLGMEDYYPSGGLSIGDVHLVTGNFVMSSTDLSIPKGKGPAISIERTYNSQNKTLGLLGWGWNLNIPKLTENVDNSVDIINPDGSKMHFDYDGTALSYKPAYGHYEILTKDSSSGTFTLSYKGGYKTIFDNTNKKVYLKDNNGFTLTYVITQNTITLTDATNRTVTMYIDTTYNRIYKIKDFDIEGQLAREWMYNYNKAGDLVEVIYPGNAKITYEYNNKHDLKAVINANENDKLANIEQYQPKKTLIYYYPDGKLKNITHEGDEKNPNIQTEISYDNLNKNAVITEGFGTADSASTTYVYDSSNRISLVTDPEGRKTKYEYGEALNPTLPTSITVAYGTADAAATVRTYDIRGNVKTVKDPKEHVTTYTYKNDEVVENVTNAMNKTTTFIYDDNLNITNDGSKTCVYVNGVLDHQLDSAGKKTTYFYDSNGYNIQIVDADKDVLQNKVFDGLGRLKTETVQGKTTSYTYFTNGLTETVSEEVDGIAQVTSYTYDKNGNRLTIKNPKDEIPTTTYQYDIFGRLELITHPDTKKEEYTYDNLGRIKTYKDQNGKVTTNSYFMDGSIKDVIDSDNKKISYLYDSRGNKDKVTDWTGVLDFDYDLNDNVVKEVKTDVDGSPVYSIGYDYNELNQNIKKTVDSNNAEYIYPDGQNLKYIDNHNNGHRIDFSYDNNNFRTGIVYGNKTSVTIDPTDAGKIENIEHKAVDGSVISSYGYTYDSDGRIKTINDRTNTATMYYDDKNRIKEIDHGNGKTSTYTFDELGNRLTANEGGVPADYHYNESGDKTQLKDYVKNGITTSFSYYLNGNTDTVTSPGKTVKYVYDAQNRLTDILNNGVLTAKYEYDGQSQRVSKTVNGKTTKYVYAQGLLVAEKDAENNTLASYLYDEKGQPLSMTRGSETYYYHFNGHGDTVALTNNAGNAVQTYKYDIWGNLLESTGNVENLFTYGGQWGYIYDSESGLYFLKTRYYDSSIGRFTTRDRFAGYENDSDSQNRYVYCQNDPVGNVDPSGESLISIPYSIFQLAVGILSFVAKGTVIGWVAFGVGVALAIYQMVLIYKKYMPYIKSLESSYDYYTSKGSRFAKTSSQIRNQINSLRLNMYVDIGYAAYGLVLGLFGIPSASQAIKMLSIIGIQLGFGLLIADAFVTYANRYNKRALFSY